MMKKKTFLTVLVLFMAITIAFASTAMADSWKGSGWAEGETFTNNQIMQYKTFDGCSWCGGTRELGMAAKQNGEANLSLGGKYESRRPDDVKVKGKFEYETGYSQYQTGPDYFQSQWGRQAGEVRGKVTSP